MSLEWIGAKKAVERTAPQAGANAGWRLVDRCFGRGEKYGAFFEGEKSPAGGGKCGLPHLVAKLLGESVTGRNIIGKMCKIKWVGKVLAGQQEESPAMQGQVPGGVW